MPRVSHRPSRQAERHGERGSALIVSLVFLIILTILGVSTMNTSRLELRMAANQQAANQAFQASASGIESTLIETNIFNTSLECEPDDSVGVDHTFYYNQKAGASFSDGTNTFLDRALSRTCFEVQGAVPAGGFSLGSKVSAFHFRILSTAQSVGGSESQQVQGFYKVGPGA